MMNYPVIVAVRLPNGQWSHVYADGMPQAGMKVPGGNSYATKEIADEAGKDRSDTVGQCRGMFDRFLLDEEPPPVEWSEDSESADGGNDAKGLMAELSKIVGMLTKLLNVMRNPNLLLEDTD